MTEETETQALSFDVVEVTSEDPSHLATELLNSSTSGDGNGWRSEKDPQSPQEIVLKLLPPSSTIQLSSLKLLCHEYLIPQKIEIIVASNEGREPADSFAACSDIRRLGYVFLETNEKSNYEARELKSVSIGSQEAAYVKLRLYDCHQNDLNTHGQVGLLAVELFGSIVEHHQQLQPQLQEPKEVDNDAYSNPPTPTAGEPKDPATITTNSKAQPPLSPPPATAQDLMERKRRSNDEITRRLDRLDRKKLERAAVEDYECAARIKSVLDDAKSAFHGLNDLEAKMKQASDAEEYFEASRFKHDRDSARIAVMESLDKAEVAIANICGVDCIEVLDRCGINTNGDGDPLLPRQRQEDDDGAAYSNTSDEAGPSLLPDYSQRDEMYVDDTGSDTHTARPSKDIPDDPLLPRTERRATTSFRCRYKGENTRRLCGRCLLS